MASFRKRGNTWEYRIRYIDRKTGKSRETSKSGFATKAEARHAAVEAEQALKRGYDPGTGDQQLKEYFDWWFVHYKKGSVSGNTEENILNHLGRINEEIGHVRMKDLNRPLYQQLMNRLGKKYAKSTLQRLNTTASEAFRDAIELGLLYYNPAERVKYPKTTKRSKTSRDKFLELEEVKALLIAAEQKWRVEKPEYAQHLYITYLLIGTGMRIGECCALTLDDVDLVNGTVNIEKTMIYDKKTLQHEVKATTKTDDSGERIIGLDAFTLEKMKEWAEVRKKRIIRFKSRPKEFFIDDIGQFIKMATYADALRYLCKTNKLRHTNPHMFRHTHETIMWEAGISDINFISARLGDKDKNILLETYGHRSARSEQLNTEKINDFMHHWTSELRQIK